MKKISLEEMRKLLRRLREETELPLKLSGRKNFGPEADGYKRDIAVIDAIIAALEEKAGVSELRSALESSLYYLPSFGEERGQLTINGQVIDIRKYVTDLLDETLKKGNQGGVVAEEGRKAADEKKN